MKAKEKKTENKYVDHDRLIDAWRVMHFALRAVIAEPDRMLAARGLTRVHHRILFFLARTPGMSVGELQTTLDVTKQALNTPLKQLREQGLIDFAKADHDARVRELELTTDGAALESKLTGEQLRLFDSAFEAAGPDAAANWFTVMHQLASTLNTNYSK
jgi:DNA-binding MarR family transcriptional regulator